MSGLAISGAPNEPLLDVVDAAAQMVASGTSTSLVVGDRLPLTSALLTREQSAGVWWQPLAPDPSRARVPRAISRGVAGR